MGPEKQALEFCLLGEAADGAALPLTQEEEPGDARLPELQDPPRTLHSPSGVSQEFGAFQGFCRLTTLNRS